jgi:hypothetical protein
MKNSVYIAVILCFLSSCGPKQEKVERIMEDGVEVVMNHLEPYQIKGEPSILHLEEEFTIDTEDDSIATLGLTDIWAINVDPYKNMYLWNSPRSKENLVYKFDSDGNFQTSFLKIGQGPGEIQSPALPIITEKGEFVITDYFPRKLFYLNFEGDIINGISFKTQVSIVYPLENGNYFAEEARRAEDGAYTDNLMILYDQDIREVQQLMNYRKEDLRSAARVKGTMIERPSVLWAISKGKIYAGNDDQEEYEILVYDFEGHLLRKIRKEHSPVEVSDEYKRKILGPYEKHPNVIVQNIAKKIYFPKYMPPYQSFFCDDVGRLFVMTFEEEMNKGEYIYDVFDPEGRFISRVGIGNYGDWDVVFRSQLVVIAKQNRLYCIQQKESGFKELTVYRMNWD